MARLPDMSPDGPPAGPVTRRTALASLGGAAAALWAPGCGPAAAQRPAFTPEMFGARGDGRTDDYEAFRRLAAAINAAGGGVVRFARRGHYLIDRHMIWDGPNANGVRHIAFMRCRGLVIDLNGSTVSVKGDFHRAADVRRVSYSAAVIPFFLGRCSGVEIRDGELNGNADRMTRDGGTQEMAGHGISMRGCTDVLIEGLHIHHFSTDGIRVGLTSEGDVVASRNVRLNEVRLTNNARQGLTNAGASGVVATDCVFSETGRTGGRYGRHSPSAGVDVEPTRRMPVKSDFRAVRCRFDDNIGALVVAGNPNSIGLVELVDCGGRTGGPGTIHPRFILSAERTVIRGGSWHNVQIGCAYAATRRFETPISVDVSGGVWTGDDPAWVPVYDVSPRRPQVRIHGNRFELAPPRPFRSNALFRCPNPNHRFEANEIFVARSGHDGEGDDLVANFRGAALVRGNRWSTDAEPPQRFVNNYAEAQVEGEVFAGSFAAVERRRP